MRYEISLQVRYFTRWNTMLVKWKLAKLNTISFWKIIEPTIKRFLSRLNSYRKEIYWNRWVQFDASMKVKKNDLIRVQLLFRFWKLTAKSQILMKKKRYRCGLLMLKSFSRESIQANNWKESQCVDLIKKHCQLRIIKLWHSVFFRKSKLCRYFQLSCKCIQHIFFQRWAKPLYGNIDKEERAVQVPDVDVKILAHKNEVQEQSAIDISHSKIHATEPGKNSFEVVKTYRKAVFQGGGGDSVVYKTFMLVRRPKSSLPVKQQSGVVPPISNHKSTVRTNSNKIG